MVEPLLFSIEEIYEFLKEDFEELQAHPDEKKHIYHFFVVAESLVDYKLPRKANRDDRTAMRNNEALLQVVSHIANDAKHYVAEAKHHKSVLRIEKSSGWFNSRWFNRHWHGPNWFTTPEYYVDLKDDAQKLFGERITIKELSTRVMDYWSLVLGFESK